MTNTEDLKKCPVDYDRHGPQFRQRTVEVAQELQATCPIAWSHTYEDHWVATGMDEVFAIARRPEVTNFRDADGSVNGYKGTAIPAYDYGPYATPSFLELDPPEQTDFRKTLNPYLSPAAVARLIPVIDAVTHACIDDHVESGTIDLVHDLATVVPAVITMGMLGLPLSDWELHSEPAHALMYTPPGSPNHERVTAMAMASRAALADAVPVLRAQPRPGLFQALIDARIAGRALTDTEITTTVMLLVGGGFDTTTALTGQSMLWLSQHRAERARLIAEIDTLLDQATEEFLRYVSPTTGAARTFRDDVEVKGVEFAEGERIWLSWSMANRSPEVFPNPNEVDLDRTANRHAAFGLGIHRCIGSNVARTLFKRMVTAILDRIPDFAVDPTSVVHYESVGQINGLVNLPATFTPGVRRGPGLAATLDEVQKTFVDERLAEAVTARRPG